MGRRTVRGEVEKAIAKIRPALGVTMIELVDAADGEVKVRVIPGTCSAGIPPEHVMMLLEEQLQEDVPSVKRVTIVD